MRELNLSRWELDRAKAQYVQQCRSRVSAAARDSEWPGPLHTTRPRRCARMQWPAPALSTWPLGKGDVRTVQRTVGQGRSLCSARRG